MGGNINLNQTSFAGIASALGILYLTGASYDDAQDWLNSTQGAGVFTGCLITEAAALDGTIDISAGSGFLKTSDSAIAATELFSITLTPGFAVDAGLNYIYIYNNAGTLTIAKTNDPTAFDYRTKIPIGLVQKGAAGHLHIINSGLRIQEFSKQVTRRIGEARGAERVSGMLTTVSVNDTLGLDITAGLFYHALNRIITGSIDTGAKENITGVDQGNKQFTVAADWTDILKHGDYITVGGSTGNDGVYAVQTVTEAAGTSTITVEEAIPNAVVDGHIYGQTFKYYYRDGGGGWTPVNGQYQIDNVNWDDDSGVLNDLTANRYGVHWVFLDYDGHLLVVYGQGDYKLAEAEDAALPGALPNLPAYFSIPIAKIILKKNEGNLANGTITTPFEVSFARGSVVNHNDLGGIGVDDHHPQIHAPSHIAGAGDPLAWATTKTTAAWAKSIGATGDYADWATMIVAMPDQIAHAVTVTIEDGTILTEACDIKNKHGIASAGVITIQAEKYFPTAGAIPTADSATATTLRDAALAAAALGNDYFNGCWIRIINGTGMDNGFVLITDYVDATGDVVVAAWPGTQPDNTSRYIIVGALIDGGGTISNICPLYYNSVPIYYYGIGFTDDDANSGIHYNNFVKFNYCVFDKADYSAVTSVGNKELQFWYCGLVENNIANDAGEAGLDIYSTNRAYLYRCGISLNNRRGVYCEDGSFAVVRDCFGSGNVGNGLQSIYSGMIHNWGSTVVGTVANEADPGTADTDSEDQAVVY